jgi:hypothetical protein
METFLKTTLIAIFVSVSISVVNAQPKLDKLDQVELMKQFIGTWKCELGKDTLLISENIPFGSGMLSKSQIVTKNTNLDSIIQLYGYDKKADKFIVAEQIKSSPVIEICTAWFTSKSTGEIIVTNPENSPFKFKFEFKSPDLIVQTAIQDNKVFKEITGTRILNDKKSTNR